MAQIARKLASEAKLWMVNCDLGHSLFMAQGRIKIFLRLWRKTRLCRTRSVREIRAFGPQTRKNYFIWKYKYDVATLSSPFQAKTLKLKNMKETYRCIVNLNFVAITMI